MYVTGLYLGKVFILMNLSLVVNSLSISSIYYDSNYDYDYDTVTLL